MLIQRHYRFVRVWAVLMAIGLISPAVFARDRHGHRDQGRDLNWNISVGSGGFGLVLHKSDHFRHHRRQGHHRQQAHFRRHHDYHRHGGHAADCRFNAGHYAYRQVRVLIEEARYEKRWVPPAYETRYRGRRGRGRAYQVCVREGYYETYHQPARYEYQQQRYWVPESRVCVAACR